MKKVIITGVTGQDGSLMADYLLENTDHEIHGGVRRLSVKNHKNIKHLRGNKRFKLFDFDLSDPHSIRNAVIEIKPDYFINFAAQSFVGVSWDIPRQTFANDAMAVLDILEAIRLFLPDCRFYNAGSSEEFGDILHTPQNEEHPLRPRSPYGAAKASARHIVKVYRESYDLFAIQGWLFNHEGTRRGKEFVTRKISKGVARIFNEFRSVDKWRGRHGAHITSVEPIMLGNLDSLRDWSDAQDFMHGVWLMINNDQPKEYILASGESHSIREFIETAFNTLKIGGTWFNPTGERPWADEEYDPLEESYIHVNASGDIPLVKVSSEFYRPNEVSLLQGDPSLAIQELGYNIKPDFKRLVSSMVIHDVQKYFPNSVFELTTEKELL